MTDNNIKYLPVKDYAEKYDIGLSNVYARIRRGHLIGKKIGTYQLVQDK